MIDDYVLLIGDGASLEATAMRQATLTWKIPPSESVDPNTKRNKRRLAALMRRAAKLIDAEVNDSNHR